VTPGSVGRRRLRPQPSGNAKFQRETLEREGCCQYCGSMQSLQIHRVRSGGQFDRDIEGNLITLCAPCYVVIHLRVSE
jgi:hypothetical protein